MFFFSNFGAHLNSDTMSKAVVLTIMALIVIEGKAQITDPTATEVWEPIPRHISFTDNETPSDAIVLFDGSNTDAWQHWNGQPVNWTLENDILTVKPGSGGIFTKESFEDVQLHVEWRAPKEIISEGQGRGNSGVFLQNRYEVQVLDSYQNQTYPNGQAASVYKQHIPLVNAMKAPGEWQKYDIIFKAPRFNSDGMKISPGTLTVLHNGVLVQNHVEVKGTTEYIGLPKNEAHGAAPIQLQDHSNLVSYRNIWVRRL